MIAHATATCSFIGEPAELSARTSYRNGRGRRRHLTGSACQTDRRPERRLASVVVKCTVVSSAMDSHPCSVCAGYGPLARSRLGAFDCLGAHKDGRGSPRSGRPGTLTRAILTLVTASLMLCSPTPPERPRSWVVADSPSRGLERRSSPRMPYPGATPAGRRWRCS